MVGQDEFWVVIGLILGCGLAYLNLKSGLCVMQGFGLTWPSIEGFIHLYQAAYLMYRKIRQADTRLSCIL